MNSQPQLIGRAREVTLLAAHLRELKSRTVPAVAVVGEPGIGKSRLLAELVDLSEADGYLTLMGRAAQFEREVPFAVFIEAMDAYLASQDSESFEVLGLKQLTELARIFPALAGLGTPGSGVVQAERYRAHYAVRALLDLLASGRPLVLVLDDLQWADQGSLELASYLLRRPARRRAMLVLAYRPGEAPAILCEAQDDALAQGRLDLIDVGPLSPDDVRELIPADIGPSVHARLCDESGGNPFYLLQLLRSLSAPTQDADAGAHGVASGDVPAAVAAALAREVASLTGEGRKLLEGASVAGDPFALESALAAADLSETRLDALDELLTLQLLRPTEVPRRFSFRHPIVRKAVYVETGVGWRLGAHARVRDALRAAGAPATELAHHVEQAALPGDIEAIAILEEAGKMGAPLAPALAAHWLTAASRLLPPRDTARRSELLVRISTALGASGRLEESRSALVEAIDLLPPGAETKRVHLSALLGALGHLLGRHEEARAQLRSTLAGLPDPTSPEAATLQIELAADAIYAADWDSALAWAERALAGADSSGQRALSATAEALLCMACLGMGQIPEAEQHRAMAETHADGLADAELGRRLGAPYCLGFAEYFLGRYEDGVRHLQRGIVLSRSSGRAHFLTHMKLGTAWNLIQLGRAVEATELADEAIEEARLVGNLQALAWALGIRCWIACVVGNVEVALRMGEEAVIVGADRDESLVSALVRAHLGMAHLESGAHERCVTEMERAGAPAFADFFSDQRPRLCEVLCRAEIGLGRLKEAQDWVERGEAFAEGLGLPVASASAYRARARLLVAQDKPELAVELALAAAEMQESRCARIDAAHTRILAGQALAASQDPARAVAEFECAFEEFDACGAVRPRDQASRELRRLGRRVPRHGRRGSCSEGVEALSERQREIAELTAEGKTNREIAAVLFISEKTVEKHLSSIFGKLGISGRAAIGAKLTQK